MESRPALRRSGAQGQCFAVPTDDLTPTAPYRPSAFYWRRAIRAAAKDHESLTQMALALVTELEGHKAFIRELGYIPPKDTVHPDEMREKGWGVGDASANM